MKHIPTNKGTIKLVHDELSIFKNKLILDINWFEKDHTDSEHNNIKLDIQESQWHKIQDEKLIGKEVEFELDKFDIAKIIFTEKVYSAKEVQGLVIKAWNQGYDDGWKRLRVPAIQSPIDFWKTNKK